MVFKKSYPKECLFNLCIIVRIVFCGKTRSGKIFQNFNHAWMNRQLTFVNLTLNRILNAKIVIDAKNK